MKDAQLTVNDFYLFDMDTPRIMMNETGARDLVNKMQNERQFEKTEKQKKLDIAEDYAFIACNIESI